jgi:RluA family pseudouridine synthase
MQRPSVPSRRFLPRGLEILHEDPDVLVVNKPPGLLTISTDREKSRTAYFALTDYVRKGAVKSRNRIFIVHRLDRETSGVLVFAKNEAAKFWLQQHWDETKKRYLAVVQGRCKRPADTITTYLAENSAHHVYSTPDPRKGRLSTTAYTVLKETRDLALLDVDLLTGRKHQIRVHLAERGLPVVGDKTYGRTDKGYRHLALHARCLAFRHPVTGEPLTFTAPPPGYFRELVGSFDHLLPAC